MILGYHRKTVDNTDALLHHYRSSVDSSIPATSTLVDRTAHTWAEQLMKNVNSVCRRTFKASDGSCPVPGGRTWEENTSMIRLS